MNGTLLWQKVLCRCVNNKLRILRQGDHAGLCVWVPKCDHKCPYKREAERFEAEEEKVVTEKRYSAGFEDGGGGHRPRDTGNTALEAGKGQKMSSEPLKGHLNFSPVKLTLDF